MTKDMLRVIRFRPYRKGKGPTFQLKVWDAHKRGFGEKDVLGYRLSEVDAAGRVSTIFRGEDFGNSPLHATDSDAAVVGIMSFLTLKPGDTDPEYFEGYKPWQVLFCSQHAEALACEVERRFPDCH